MRLTGRGESVKGKGDEKVPETMVEADPIVVLVEAAGEEEGSHGDNGKTDFDFGGGKGGAGMGWRKEKDGERDEGRGEERDDGELEVPGPGLLADNGPGKEAPGEDVTRGGGERVWEEEGGKQDLERGDGKDVVQAVPRPRSHPQRGHIERIAQMVQHRRDHCPH